MDVLNQMIERAFFWQIILTYILHLQMVKLKVNFQIYIADRKATI